MNRPKIHLARRYINAVVLIPFAALVIMFALNLIVRQIGICVFSANPLPASTALYVECDTSDPANFLSTLASLVFVFGGTSLLVFCNYRSCL